MHKWRVETWYEFIDAYCDGEVVGCRVVKGEGPKLIVAPNGSYRCIEGSIMMVPTLKAAFKYRDALNAEIACGAPSSML